MSMCGRVGPIEEGENGEGDEIASKNGKRVSEFTREEVNRPAGT